MHFDGDTATIVTDFNPAIFLNSDVYFVAVPCHGFIDCVVDNFPDEVMETALTG